MRTHYNILLQRVRQLQRILSAPQTGRERDWAEEVGQTLDKLLLALRRHTRKMDAPGGTDALVDMTRPTLARQADELREDQDTFLVHTQALREELRQAVVASPTDVPDFGFLQSRLTDFAAGLEHHCEEEARLVLESMTTDIGVGD